MIQERICSRCSNLFLTTEKDTMYICKKCNCERVKSNLPEKRMHNRAQQRAKKRNIEFNLKLEDIELVKYCLVLGFEMFHTVGKSGGYKYSLSLDRIDTKKLYEKGNVQVISYLANCMKNSATLEELILFADWVYKTYKLLVNINEVD